MPTYTFILPGWRGKYTATAPTEHEARVAINPYIRLYRDAKRRAKDMEKRGATGEAAWYRHMAEIHAKDAKAFHAAAKLARSEKPIPVAKAAPIPVAKKAPPQVPILCEPIEETRKKPRPRRRLKQILHSHAKKGKLR